MGYDKKNKRCHKPTGFTLVELLVVISIIALLLSILMPSLGRAREQARSVVCGGQLKQLVLGINLYATDNDGIVPDYQAYSTYEPFILFARLNNDKSTYLGALYSAGYGMDSPDIFYCPSAKGSVVHPRIQFDDDPSDGVCWFEYWTPGHSGWWITYSSYYYLPSRMAFGPFTGTSGYPGWQDRIGYRKLTKMRSGQAIISDTVGYCESYAHYTRKGFNVGYADGSVRFWKDRKRWYENAGYLAWDHVTKKFMKFLYPSEILELYKMFDSN